MAHRENHIPPVHLLWTGGWDSTYQLLKLLLVHRVHVTPYYLIDAERKSTGLELLAMKRIKDRLFADYPYTKELLGATNYFAVSDVLPDAEISHTFQAILADCRIGSQYEWLARFCKQFGIFNMQLCMEYSVDRDPGQFNLYGMLTPKTDGGQKVHILDTKYKNKHEYQLFKYFSFPLIMCSKKHMIDFVKENDMEEIMELTWFCHKPTLMKKPCGLCVPCSVAIRDGLGHRVPLGRRLISYCIRTIFRPFKSRLKIFGILRKQSKNRRIFCL